MTRPAQMEEVTMRLSVPAGGIRAGDVMFKREGVVRSMPKPEGRRVDRTLFAAPRRVIATKSSWKPSD